LQRRLFVQDTKHHLQQKIVGNDKVAFHVMREYLDGERLLATAVQEPDERGKVVRHSEVQEFDE
jgi:hypothetical protein